MLELHHVLPHQARVKSAGEGPTLRVDLPLSHFTNASTLPTTSRHITTHRSPMILCSQAVPCKSCKCCATGSAVMPVVLAPVLTTSPPDRVQWFKRTKAEYTSGYHTEACLKIEPRTSMDDDAA